MISLAGLYWIIGVLMTIYGMTTQPRRSPGDRRGFLALLLGSACWPVIVSAWWYDHQRAAWRGPPLCAHRWLRSRERTGAFTCGRVTLIIRYPPRRTATLGPWTVLVRPRPSSAPPVLVRRRSVSVNLGVCQYHFLRPELDPAPAVHAPTHQQGFTLTEVLIVIAILGLLIGALLFSYSGAVATARHKTHDAFVETCLITAEKRRDYLDNTLQLPGSCAELGLALPRGLSSARFQDLGAAYLLDVSGPDYSRQERLLKTAQR